MRKSSPPIVRQYSVQRPRLEEDRHAVNGEDSANNLALKSSSPLQGRSQTSDLVKFSKGSGDPYVWVGRSLGLRRCSTIIGMVAPVILQHNVGLKQKTKPKLDQKFAKKYRQEVEELREEYAQVDAFPLMVEYFSPRAKRPKIVARVQTGQDSMSRDYYIADPDDDRVATDEEISNVAPTQVDAIDCAPTTGQIEPSGANNEFEQFKNEMAAGHLISGTQELVETIKNDVGAIQECLVALSENSFHEGDNLPADIPQSSAMKGIGTPKRPLSDSNAAVCSGARKLWKQASPTLSHSLDRNYLPVNVKIDLNDSLPRATSVFLQECKRDKYEHCAAASPMPSCSHICLKQSSLDQLLAVCGQQAGQDQIPSMETVVGEHIDLNIVEKIGEGTYGEAFKANSTVVKIVPINGETIVNGQPQKTAEEILGEAIISRMVSDLGSNLNEQNYTRGFALTKCVKVCHGHYCPSLISAWHRWNIEHSTENDPVDSFVGNQLYAVFIIEHAGQDLDSYKPTSFSEIKSILGQVVMVLSIGEQAFEFEHRDLHQGNILINKIGSATPMEARIKGCPILVHHNGVEVVLIDFTFSRLSPGDEQAVFYDLSTDLDLFNGPKFNLQANVYRKMKKALGNVWSEFCPKTNLLWVHYLIESLLAPMSINREQMHSLRGLRQRVLKADSCIDLLSDEFFKDIISMSST